MAKGIGFLIVVRLITICFSETELTWQNPLPQGSRLNDVYVIGNDTAVAVGGRGTIIRTIDNGETWEMMDSKVRYNLESVSFTDAKHGCAIGSGAILMTSDGGSSWELTNTGLPDSVPLVYQFFLNSKYGWVRNDLRTMLRTTDSGNTWETIEYADVFDVGRYAKRFYFTDSVNGIALWGSPLLTTSDGGKTWLGQGKESSSHDIHFLDSINWWIPSKYIQRSRDGGKTWTTEYTAENTLYGIYMVDTLYGWGAGTWNTIVHTSTGSAGWQVYPSPIIDSSGIVWDAVHCHNRKHGYIVGTYGNILKIADNSDELELVSRGFNDRLNGVFAMDSLTCYAIGQYGTYLNNDTVRGVVFRTTDGGENWERCFDGRQEWAVDVSLNSIFFTNRDTGWVAGGNGRILRTTDGGGNWQKCNSNTNGILYDIFFVDDSVGYACGWIDSLDREGAGVYLKTVDGGRNWQRYLMGNWMFNSLYFFCRDTGFMTTNITLYKTVDGAQTWDTVKTLPPVLYLKVFFLDRNIGFAYGEYAKVYKTLDGGESWIKTNSDLVTSEGLIDLHAVNPDTVYACGGAGLIIKTEDSGENWRVLNNSHCEHILMEINFCDKRHGWTVGRNGTIMKITETEVITAIKKKEKSFNAVNSSQSLRITNYTHNIHVSFTITKAIKTNITLYNMQGKMLLNHPCGMLDKGVHEKRIPVRNLSPGLYVVKIQNGNGETVQKTILTR